MNVAGAFEFDVFLSYSSQDRLRVERLANHLRRDGLRVWFDEWEIKPGDQVFMKVEQGLQNARALVLCLSLAALKSDWVSLERNTALFRDPANHQRRFIPVILDDCRKTMPDTLRGYRHIDLRPCSIRRTYRQLLEACRPKELGWEPRIKEAMNKKVTFDLVETPLQDVLNFLSSLMDVTIILDTGALNNAPNVTLRVNEMKFQSALNWILKLACLKYRLQDEAIFIIAEDSGELRVENGSVRLGPNV